MKKIKWIVLLVITVLLGYLLYYLLSSAGPSETANNALRKYSAFQTESKNYYAWMPQNANGTAVIFYQGGKVEALAYADLMLPLLEEGYTIFFPEFPFNLAVLNINAADGIIAEYPEIKKWWIGGHSLGGVMAADYVYKHPDQIAGLFLLGAYPQDKTPLVNYKGKVIAFFGTLDGLVGTDGIDGWRKSLPEMAKIIMIQGGNHAQFGDYGPQKGDLKAEISSAEQKAVIISELLKIMAP